MYFCFYSNFCQFPFKTFSVLQSPSLLIFTITEDQSKTVPDKNLFDLYSKLTFQDAGDGSANTETTAYAAYSPLDRHIHVRSSNREISVGKYVVFHVKSNFALTYFDWIIVSKNLILKSGREYASDIHPGNFLRIIF